MRDGKWDVADAKDHLKETGHKVYRLSIGEKPLDWMVFECITCIVEAKIKYIRVQVRDTREVSHIRPECHTIVEFLNGSRACSCGIERGHTPTLRVELQDDSQES